MSDSKVSRKECMCWIPVLATVMILFSAFDIGFGVTMGSFADELMDLGEEVSSQKTGLRVARVFRTLSGGLVNLGNSAVGVQVKDLVESLPPLWVLALIAWVRVLLAIIGFLLGWAFAFRIRYVIPAILVYSAGSIIWEIVSLIVSRGLYSAMSENGIELDMWILLILNLFFHIVWPLYLGIRIWKAKRDGVFTAW